MLQFTRWKIIAILLTCLAGFIVAMPNFFSKETVASWPSFVPKKQLPLGLDLQGGAHLLLAMDQDEIKKDWLNNLRDELRKASERGEDRLHRHWRAGDAARRQARQAGGARGGAQRAAQDQAVDRQRRDSGPGGYDVDVSEGADAGTVVIKPTEQGIRQRISSAAASSIETINRRVNNLGTSESTIVRQGTDRILIQFPGLKDTKELKAAHRRNGEAHLPRGASLDHGRGRQDSRPYPPVTKSIRATRARGQANICCARRPSFRAKTSPMRSRASTAAPASRSSTSASTRSAPASSETSPRTTSAGRSRSCSTTKYLSAPVIREAILGGSGQISGKLHG